MMLNIMRFDTHAIVKKLKAVGFTDGQAEALTDTVSHSQDIDLSHLATKADLLEVKNDLKVDIANMRYDILKWLFGAIGFQTVVIIGAIIALLRIVQH